MIEWWDVAMYRVSEKKLPWSILNFEKNGITWKIKIAEVVENNQLDSNIYA